MNHAYTGRRGLFRASLCVAAVVTACIATAAFADDTFTNSDNSSFVPGTGIVGAGNVQVETGLQRTQDGDGTAALRAWSTPTLLRFGSNAGYEFRAQTNAYNRVRTYSAVTNGMGDVTAGAKWAVPQSWDKDVTVAFVAQATFPSPVVEGEPPPILVGRRVRVGCVCHGLRPGRYGVPSTGELSSNGALRRLRVGAEVSELALQIGYFGFQEQDPADAGEGEPLAGHVGHALHLEHLVAGVPPVPSVRAQRLDHLFRVESAHEGRLHAKHRGDLPDCEDGEFVVEGRGHVSWPTRPPAPAATMRRWPSPVPPALGWGHVAASPSR